MIQVSSITLNDNLMAIMLITADFTNDPVDLVSRWHLLSRYTLVRIVFSDGSWVRKLGHQALTDMTKLKQACKVEAHCTRGFLILPARPQVKADE